jgi:hypothetical protein
VAKVKAGVVGIGRMGEYHVGVLSEMQDVDLAGVVDVDPQRRKAIQDNYGIPNYANCKDLFGRVDAAVVAVPTTLHYPVAKELLNNGIHVLLEKPCANDLNHARELFQLAKDKSLTLHIGHVERFNGAVQELHKIVGSPIFVEFLYRPIKTFHVTDVQSQALVLGQLEKLAGVIEIVGTRLFKQNMDAIIEQFLGDRIMQGCGNSDNCGINPPKKILAVRIVGNAIIILDGLSALRINIHHPGKVHVLHFG